MTKENHELVEKSSVIVTDNALTFLLEGGPVVVEKGSHAYYDKIYKEFQDGTLTQYKLERLLDIRTNDTVRKALELFKSAGETE